MNFHKSVTLIPPGSGRIPMCPGFREPCARAGAAMRILSTLALAAALLSSAHAQTSCTGQMAGVSPVALCVSALQSLCLCGPNGNNCHLQWVCPAASTASAPQIDSSIPLQGKSPTFNDPIETMRKVEEIRQMRQQTELLRQQAEALREQNQQMEPRSAADPFQGPYLGLAMVTMPKPTGHAKHDQRAWSKWTARQDASVQSAIPSWSPGAYERFSKMAIDQAMKAR